MFANRREDRRIGQPTSHWKFAIACALAFAHGSLGAATTPAAKAEAVMQACASERQALQALEGRGLKATDDDIKKYLIAMQNRSRNDLTASLEQAVRHEARLTAELENNSCHAACDPVTAMQVAAMHLEACYLKAVLGQLDGQRVVTRPPAVASPPASAKLPASAPTQVPPPGAGSAEEQRAALEALQRVINDTSELEAAKASAERTMAEVTAELEREVEATKDCGWFPEHCKPDKPKRKPKPPSLQTVDNVGTRCARLTLEDFRVDEHGNASYEFVLTNRCGTMQLVNVQVAEDVNDPAPGTPSGLAWMGSHPDWSGAAPGGLGFEPVVATYWHYLMPPRSEHRGNRVAATPGQKLHAWLASCDAYADGYYQVLFQASPYLNQDNRVACVKNRPGAPR